MKKIYQKPLTEVYVVRHQSRILSGSDQNGDADAKRQNFFIDESKDEEETQSMKPVNCWAEDESE
jgi:hypothetical protein